MVILNAVLYLSSVWYSILSFNQFFFIKILSYWFVTKSIVNYRKHDFSSIFILQKIWYFPQLQKIQKYGIYVEGFYENVVFHAVKGDINFWQILFEHNFKQTKKHRFNGGFSGHWNRRKIKNYMIACISS